MTIPSEIGEGGFNYGWPTLQMNLVFRALNQNGADRVEVVIVTASERARPCFGHLKGGKTEAHDNNPYCERNPLTSLNIQRERHRKKKKKGEKVRERIRLNVM